MDSIHPNGPRNERKFSITTATERKVRLSSNMIQLRLDAAGRSGSLSRELLKDKIDGIPPEVSEHSLIDQLFRLRNPHAVSK